MARSIVALFDALVLLALIMAALSPPAEVVAIYV